MRRPAAQLEFQLQRELLHEEVSGSPVLRVGSSGLRIHARDVSFSIDTLSLVLLTSYKLPEPFYASFHDVCRAIVFYLEDAETGLATAATWEDPAVTYEPMDGPNFRGAGPVLEDNGVRLGGWVGGIFEIRLAAPPPRASLFIRASIHHVVSNTLAVNAREGTVTSYQDGAPRPVEVADLSTY